LVVRARATTIWYVDTPDPMAALRASEGPDRDVADTLVERLYPDRDVVALGARCLADAAAPDPGTVYIGCYPGVSVVCDPRLAVPRPSLLGAELTDPLSSDNTYLVGLDPELGWGGFAHWQRGVLRRSFSATRINILENEGLPLVWERPFWAGEHPMGHESGRLPDPQRLPFDPLQFADAANLRWLGFGQGAPAFDTSGGDAPLDPGAIMLRGYAHYPRGEAPDAARRAAAPRPARSWWRWFAPGADRVASR
jgi:hypothetical protein